MRLIKRVPLMSIAHAFVGTSIRDGLSLYPLEYVAVQELINPHRGGIVVLSEFMSCNRILRGAYRVNPWRQVEMYQQFETLMRIDEGTIAARHEQVGISYSIAYFHSYKCICQHKILRKYRCVDTQIYMFSIL